MESTDSVERFLKEMAARYIWWKTPEEAVLHAERVIAQVMEIGVYKDVERLIDVVGEPALVGVIRSAEAGWFSPRSWHYWHYRLGLAESGKVPPLPIRKMPE